MSRDLAAFFLTCGVVDFLFIYSAWRAHKKGYFSSRGVHVQREQQPGFYWTLMGVALCGSVLTTFLIFLAALLWILGVFEAGR